MKVVLVNFGFAEYTTELANSLHEIADLTLVQPESTYSYIKDYLNPQIKVIHFKKYRIRDPRNIFSIRSMMRIIESVNPDVLHVQETNDPWFDLSRLFSDTAPLVTTVHDVFRHPGDRDLIPGSDLTRQLPISRSQQVIVHGSDQKNKLIQRSPQLHNRINIIPHGELGSLYKRNLGLNSIVKREPYTILFFGRIWPYKGLNYLLEAMPRVIENVPEVRLIVAGRGEDLTEPQYSSILSDHKHFTVYNRSISMDEVAQLFLRSTTVVLPYIEASQSGVACLAFGFGTPIIASDVGGLGEIVNNNIDGLLIPPRDVIALANSMISLLGDRKLQLQMQSAAMVRCKSDLSWQKIASLTLKVYEKAAQRR